MQVSWSWTLSVRSDYNVLWCKPSEGPYSKVTVTSNHLSESVAWRAVLQWTGQNTRQINLATSGSKRPSYSLPRPTLEGHCFLQSHFCIRKINILVLITHCQFILSLTQLQSWSGVTKWHLQSALIGSQGWAWPASPWKKYYVNYVMSTTKSSLKLRQNDAMWIPVQKGEDFVWKNQTWGIHRMHMKVKHTPQVAAILHRHQDP